MKTLCYLGLGSNLRTPKRQLRQAIHALKFLPKTTLTKTSTIERTEPLSRGYQPEYCNLVVELRTALPPCQLHQHCIRIEKKQQRTRKKRWASRTLDIDILIYGAKSIRSKQLTIPHPRIWQRTFVYRPLRTLNPTLFENSIHNQESCT